MTSKDRYTVNELSLFGEAEMGGFSLEEIILAYRKCLRGKLGTHEAQLFQMNYMEECVRLWRDLNAGLYQVSRYISFASFRPVLREIFGSAFRDRVVDTLLAEKLAVRRAAHGGDDTPMLGKLHPRLLSAERRHQLVLHGHEQGYCHEAMEQRG